MLRAQGRLPAGTPGRCAVQEVRPTAQQLAEASHSSTLGEHPYYAQFLSYVDEIDAHGSAWSDDAPPFP